MAYTVCAKKLSVYEGGSKKHLLSVAYNVLNLTLYVGIIFSLVTSYTMEQVLY
jgi:hypothetical protein